MEVYERGFFSISESGHQIEEVMDVRKGQWTEEEDSMLKAYVTLHGEGRWNSVARFSGLRRTGKSCRLRWLNYLRPAVRRGSITLEEQLLIIQLHSIWGNSMEPCLRWSKIAEHLPGRTDNEIKNYWRTKVQKQAKKLECDVNSPKFRDALRYEYTPRLIEQISRAKHESPSGQLTYGNETESVQVDQSLLPESSSETQVTYGSTVAETWGIDEQSNGNGWLGGGDYWMESEWCEENIWFLQQQLYDDEDGVI
ncbi:hypothetical protein Gohar_004844 [Gossypium harknessii]|uniref:Uncharacterized protein n=1 Tax=Gossypium harknessii TaxID=34285 RepID=A0A7J9H639_9ROSI|nr:hypothetical protein [Gossypium harknessii]